MLTQETLQIVLNAPHEEFMGDVADYVGAMKDNDEIRQVVYSLMNTIHGMTVKNGFWDMAVIDGPDGVIFDPAERSIGEQIALMHSELSEALEADRKDLQDDKLPEYDGLTVELADCIIRIMDTACAYDLPLWDALCDKIKYNASRPYKHGKSY